MKQLINIETGEVLYTFGKGPKQFGDNVTLTEALGSDVSKLNKQQLDVKVMAFVRKYDGVMNLVITETNGDETTVVAYVDATDKKVLVQGREILHTFGSDKIEENDCYYRMSDKFDGNNGDYLKLSVVEIDDIVEANYKEVYPYASIVDVVTATT